LDPVERDHPPDPAQETDLDEMPVQVEVGLVEDVDFDLAARDVVEGRVGADADRGRVADAGAQPVRRALVDQPARVDPVRRDESLQVGRQVRGREAELPSALEAVDDFAEHRRRSPEKLPGRLDVALGEQLADPRGRHTAIHIEGAHIGDDIHPEAELRPDLAQDLRVAGTSAAEAEVLAHEHRLRTQGADEDALDELPRREVGERAIEPQHERRVDAGLSEQPQLLSHAHEVFRAHFGSQQAERVAVAGDGDDLRAAGGGIHPGALEDRPEAGVHAVELADRDHGRTESGRDLPRLTEDDHVATARAASASWASRAGGWVISHHRPRNGRTSGMNRYPMPKVDHTVASGNRSGRMRLRVPMTSTPSSSKLIATQATRYQTTEPAKISASVARM